MVAGGIGITEKFDVSSNIKFRVRSKETGKLVCCYQAGIYMTPDTGQLYQGNLNVTDHYDIEQHVFMKDINGTELYVGDDCIFDASEGYKKNELPMKNQQGKVELYSCGISFGGFTRYFVSNIRLIDRSLN